MLLRYTQIVPSSTMYRRYMVFVFFFLVFLFRSLSLFTHSFPLPLSLTLSPSLFHNLFLSLSFSIYFSSYLYECLSMSPIWQIQASSAFFDLPKLSFLIHSTCSSPRSAKTFRKIICQLDRPINLFRCFHLPKLALSRPDGTSKDKQKRERMRVAEKNSDWWNNKLKFHERKSEKEIILRFFE